MRNGDGRESRTRVHVLAFPDSLPTKSRPHGGVFIFRQLSELIAAGAAVTAVRTSNWAPPRPVSVLWAGGRAIEALERDALRETQGVEIVTVRALQPVPSRLFRGDSLDRQIAAVVRAVERQRLPRPEVVYGCFLSTGGYIATRVAQTLGVPSVAIARGDDVHLWPRRWPGHRRRLEFTLQHADHVLACSLGLADDAASWFPAGTVRPIGVIYNGVDLDRFMPRSITPSTDDGPNTGDSTPDDPSLASCADGGERQRRILAIGTANRAKGWIELLDAWAELAPRHEGWVLRALASPDGGERVDLPAEVASRNLARRVELEGDVAPEAMIAEYHAAEVFVSASHGEGLSNALLEAMACGLPCIATRVGGHAELIRDDTEGVLVEARDTTALIRSLDSMLSEPARRLRLAAGARAAAARIGSVAQNAEQLLRLLEDAVAEQPSSGT